MPPNYNSISEISKITPLKESWNVLVKVVCVESWNFLNVY
jgi:hypothetical protein